FSRTLFARGAISRPASKEPKSSPPTLFKTVPGIDNKIPETMPYAFISYSHKDARVIHQLAAHLTQEEIPLWLDNQLAVGERWEEAIMKRLHGCTVFLIAISPDAKQSTFVDQELGVALEQHKPIIPILLAGKPFPELEGYQFVSLLDTDQQEIRFIERLRDVLTPNCVPSEEVRRRRVEHFLLGTLDTIMGASTGARVGLGMGFDKHFRITTHESLATLDELEWVEIFLCLRERLPGRDFHWPVVGDPGKRFPTIKDFTDFVFEKLTWDEIRVL